MEDAMSNVNDQRSEHLFLDKFPLEIATVIFSFLTQDDCVTCMSVCQQWYTIVPQCSQGVWKDLCISGIDTRVKDARWRLCIGEHVRSVKFCKFREDVYLYNTMQQLINAECNQIKSLVFDECTTTLWSYHFYMLLGQLAKSTTELTFRQHSHGLCLNHVLSLCPKLMYLLFKGSVYEYLNLRNIPFATDPPVGFTNLTYLFVDVAEHRVTEKLVPIIRRCPNLRYLGYKLIYLTEYLLPDTEVIDLDEIFSLCPKLVYLEMNSEEFLKYRDTRSFDPIRMNKSKDASSLRFFTARETIHCGINKLGYYLVQNADALEYLSIYGRSNDWTSVLKRLRLPRLRKLACKDITCEDGTMDMLLGRCPALEDLSIMCSGNVNLHILSALQVLPNLKRLELNGISLHYYSNTSSGSVTQFDHLEIDATDFLYMLRASKSLSSADVVGLRLLGTEDDDAAFEQIRSLGFELTKRDRYGLHDLYLTKE
ncbi:hypothetical protein BJV82DRAFT_652143 [Fennellomyces sp. T-0311]|nr:hypothetical protein BJV82DRAFT_652143 [Fennellomyces sp. T-0311]